MNKSVTLCLAVYLRVSCPECELHGRAGSLATTAVLKFLKVCDGGKRMFGDDTRTNLKPDHRPTDNECPIARSEGEDDLDEIIKEQKIVKPRSCCIETAGQEQRRRLTGNRTYGRIDA